MLSRTFRARVRPTSVLVAALSVATLASSAARAASSVADPSGENIVTIDAEDSVIPSLEAAYWIVDSASPLISLTLDSPSNGTGSVSFVTYIQPGTGTVYFESGQQTASAQVSFPAGPPEDTYEGWGAKWAYFALTQTSGGIEWGFPNTLYFAQVYPNFPSDRGGDDCVACMWGWLLYVLNISDDYICGAVSEPQRPELPVDPNGSSAPPRISAGGENAMTTLRRYRDEVLASSADGQFYADLYTEHSLDLSRAIVAAPSLAARLFNAHGAWVSGISALVNGNGGSFVVTQQMEDDLNSLLDTFQSVGSPALQQMLAFERGRLQLDQIAGLTMTEYQDQIEALGGPTAVEPATWGRVKALYR